MTATGLTEEAARLLGVLEDWVRSGGLAGAVGNGWSAAGSMPSWTAEHVGGSQECRLCPVCQLLALVRSGQPETFDHLTAAAGHLLDALRSALDGLGSPPAPRPAVQRIDIS